MTSHHEQAPGVAPCHGCGRRVLFAVPEGRDGDVIALDPDEGGPVIAWEDSAGTARCRRARPCEQLALGEYLFRFHDAVCAAVAPVRPIRSARSLRRTAPRYAGRRQASAR